LLEEEMHRRRLLGDFLLDGGAMEASGMQFTSHEVTLDLPDAEDWTSVCRFYPFFQIILFDLLSLVQSAGFCH
jgi:hypothetical protein